MRIHVIFVFCLILNNVITQSSNTNPTLSTEFNCEELTSHIQTIKESKKSKKEKFSCIMNLLKSALSDEFDQPQCQVDDINCLINVVNEKKIKCIADKIPDNENEETENDTEKALFDKLVAKITQTKTNDSNNTQNLDVPTMIPIFKPRPVIRNEFSENFNPVHPIANPRPIGPEAFQANSNPKHQAVKFTIPCQRAADVLDMSYVPTPRESDIVQPNVMRNSPAPSPTLVNQSPVTVSVHSADSDKSVAILFKPKAISLAQLYGNLLKKITITVLVPYHMSKMGQQ